MTIRRRLYVSNILMIVLPVVICLVVVCVLSAILMGAFGFSRNGHHGVEINFLRDARIVAGGWDEQSSAADLAQSLAGIAADFPDAGAALVVYRDGQAVYTLGAIPGGAESSAYTMVTAQVGAYTLVGLRENNLLKRMVDDMLGWRVVFLGLLALGGMAAVIIAVNLMLTRMIFRHIMPPLETLSDGVHQIADGNLSYRIRYEGKDEFTPVIDDFNDMAAHLQDMVAGRQRDEESRRELIAGISHDLRTPLTSIIGYVEGLEKGVATTPDMQARYLSIIHEQADSLSHTINQLFLFTKLDTDSFPMHMQRVSLGEALREDVELVSDAYAENGLAITLRLPSVPLYARADRVQLRNVLTNILENSVKYGGKNGCRIEITCMAEGMDAIITLTDDGPGVTEATLAKLFGVFYRGDASRQNTKDGSGLGLAISARILQRLGGGITAANATPHGLSIRITLPLAQEDIHHAENTDR